jgi:hypothetical protein
LLHQKYKTQYPEDQANFAVKVDTFLVSSKVLSCLQVQVQVLMQQIEDDSNTAATVHRMSAWCRVLLEKLTVTQLVKKFHAFYATRKFITVFTKARH